MIPTTIKTDQISQQLQAKTVAPVKPVIPVTPVTFVADPGNTAHEFIEGQKYKAIVEGRLSNGNYNVLISNKLIPMHLPDTTQPGDKIELLFLSNETRLQFVQKNDQANMAKSSAIISPTGRFLDVLIQNTKKSTINPTTSTTPILAGSLANRQDLPPLLQKAIYHSGLFYESHLAKWVNGKNTLEKLQLEPQNKLNMSANPPSATSALPVNTQNLPLVQQQLMTLETGHVVWRGEVWKNQQMEWEIYEESRHDNVTDQNISKQWKTKLTLTFPELGKITATITLNTQDVQFKLSADDTETMQLLKTEQIPFKTNLQTAGLTIRSFELHHND